MNHGLIKDGIAGFLSGARAASAALHVPRCGGLHAFGQGLVAPCGGCGDGGKWAVWQFLAEYVFNRMHGQIHKQRKDLR